jgi:hypothetical protein
MDKIQLSLQEKVVQTSWWTDYKTKLALWATQFKDQEMYGLKCGMNHIVLVELMDSQILFGCLT